MPSVEARPDLSRNCEGILDAIIFILNKNTKMSKRYRGELLKGRSHKEGGIPVQVADSHMVEMEGGEGVVNKRSMSSQDTFEFEGEDLTTCEIVSELNQKKAMVLLSIVIQ